MAKDLKVGDRVKYKDKVWTVKSQPWTYCLCEMVKLEGKLAAVETNLLEKVEDDSWKKYVLYCNPPKSNK